MAGNFNPDSETYYWEAGKGTRPRKMNTKKYEENFDKIKWTKYKSKKPNEKGV